MSSNYTSLKSNILFHDHDVIVINKPAGLPAVPDNSKSLSVLEIVQNEMDIKLYPVNRLDRPVSGIQILATSGKTQHRLSEKNYITKEYIAITEQQSIAESQTLSTFLRKDGRLRKAFCSDDPKIGYKEATLQYRIRQRLERYLVLSITLETGRFHQIRAQLSHLGCPVRGDVKYGARRKNPDRCIDLHAHRINIPHIGIQVTAPIIRSDKIWQAIDIDVH